MTDGTPEMGSGKAWMDDFAMWDTALTAGDIADLASGAKGPLDIGATGTNGEVVAQSLTGPGGPFDGQSDPNVVGFAANPDGDPWLNAFEVLLGFDPAAAADGAPSSTRLVEDAGQTWVEALVEVDAAMDDLMTWHIEWSSNLVDWTESSNARTIVAESGGMRTIAIRDDQPVSANTRRFHRLKMLALE
jgi:hypothetical protein